MLLFLIPVLTFAQTEEPEDTLKYDIEEVVVVGTRAVERIIDIPYSVFRVDTKELSFGKKVSAKDVLADVPGLFLQSRYGNSDLRISIRGFGTRSNSGVRGVRILQDGVPESEPDGESVVDAIDFTSLGGVEVIKGNLSSLYANAPGGVINFLPDMYFPSNYVASINQFGKFGYRQNGFKMGLKSPESRFTLSYHYRTLDGYRQHSNEYQHLLNTVYETYLPFSTVTLMGNYVNSLNKLPGSLTLDEYNADPFQANPQALALDFRRITQKGRVAARLRTTFSEGSNNELEVTGYGGIKEFERSDFPYYSLATRYSLGALIHLTNKGVLFGRRNNLTFGMDYAFQNGPVTEFDNLYGTRGISVENLYNGSLSNIGFYALDHFNIIDETLDLFVSGRFDRNIFARAISIPYGFTDTTRTFENFAPKVGLNYKIFPTVALYSSYGSSFDYPALSEMANTPLSSNIKYSLNPDLEPQTSRNFEFGIKGNIIRPEEEFLRKLFFEVTFFNYKIKDEIVPFIINQLTYYRNAGKTNRTGVEVGIKSHIFPELELTTNYTYANFFYEDYTTTLYGPSGTTMVDYTGKVVPSVPKHILNVILNYEFEISEMFSGLLQWDCDYVSLMYVNDANSESVSPYFYGNVMAGINGSANSINAVFYVGLNNIWDKRYVGYITVNDYYGRYYETGEPRNVHMGLNVSLLL